MVDEVLVREIRRRALFYDKYSGCSQSVLLALQEGLGIGNSESFKAATVLSGGVARRGETCGALLGALMAVGLVEGRSRMPDTPVYAAACAEADAIATEFQRRVEKEFKLKQPLKSTICWEIQSGIYGRSYDLRDTTQREAFYACGGHGDEGCPKVCGIAAEVAAEKLLPKMQTQLELISGSDRVSFMVDSGKVKAIRAKAHANENMSGCSQAVLSALQEGLNIGDTQSLKAATAFAGGMSRRGESCGALVGALMALGIEEGREKLEELPKLQGTIADGYALSNEFMRCVEKEWALKKPLPSTLCRDMQQALYGRSWNLADAAQRTDFINSGGHGDNGCLKVCGIAAEVAAEMILKKREG